MAPYKSCSRVVRDHDLIKPEHAVEMYRLLQGSCLATLPGAHGLYLGEELFADPNNKLPDFFVAMVDEFLDKLINENN